MQSFRNMFGMYVTIFLFLLFLVVSRLSMKNAYLTEICFLLSGKNCLR